MSDEPQAPLIDQEQFDTLKSLFADGFPAFLDSFYLDFEKKEQELQSALEANQLDTVAKLAHALKGSSANLGAIGIANLCNTLETASKTGNVTELKATNANLQQLYPVVKAEFVRISQNP